MLLYLVFSFLFNPGIRFKSVDARCKIVCDDIETSLIPPSGGELKLLTHLNVENWSYNWIMMISHDETPLYDEHFYINLFYMRGMANMYTSSEYFYLGFFPDGKITQQGPAYIGLFELMHSKRILNTKLVIENPYYVDENSTILEFRDSMVRLTDSSFVFLNFKELDRPGQVRYYYSWYYN